MTLWELLEGYLGSTQSRSRYAWQSGLSNNLRKNRTGVIRWRGARAIGQA